MADAVRLSPEAADIFARMEALGLKQKHLAETLDLEANKISKARTGERQLKAGEVLKAQKWLSHLERSNGQSKRPAVQDGEEETVEIIALDLSLSMGPGTLIEEFPEEERVRMSLAFVQAITRTPSDRLRLVRGIGDSMEPTLRTGDRVMIDLNERQLSRSHGVYWVDHLGTHGLKRLRASTRTTVIVMSDNPAVPDFEADVEDLRVLGRAIWFARDL